MKKIIQFFFITVFSLSSLFANSLNREADVFYLDSPINDDCESAHMLENVDNWCSAIEAFTNVDASLESNTSLPICWPSTTNDVWFVFEAIGPDVEIELLGNVMGNPSGTIESPQVTLYKGVCGDLIEMECASGPINYNSIQLFASGLITGDSYYLRVDARFSNTGTFQLCIDNGVFIISSPYADCNTSLEICDKSSRHFESFEGTGLVNDEIDALCYAGGDEFAPNWLRWTIEEAGWLTFEITPDQDFVDIDFVLFRSIPEGGCEEKESIRCMASGENVGAPFPEWEPCTGSTGLALGETDINEYAGCQEGNNNFLAPLEAESGESYILMINNFSIPEAGFTIEFDGTATFACNPIVAIKDLSSSSVEPSLLFVYPTISNGVFTMEIKNSAMLGGRLTVFNLLGQQVFLKAAINQEKTILDLSNLSSGTYVITANHNSMYATQRIVISK